MSRDKFGFRKAQVEIISLVLVTGIAVTAIGVAMVWGIPLIQKSQVGPQLTAAENLLTNIENEIKEVAQIGGQRSVQLSIAGRLEIMQDDNSVSYDITTKWANVASDWVPMNDMNLAGVLGTSQNGSLGILGENSAGVIAARAVSSGTEWATTYKLVYRPLIDESKKCYLVRLIASGNTVATAGAPYLKIVGGTTKTITSASEPEISWAGAAATTWLSVCESIDVTSVTLTIT